MFNSQKNTHKVNLNQKEVNNKERKINKGQMRGGQQNPNRKIDKSLSGLIKIKKKRKQKRTNY